MSSAFAYASSPQSPIRPAWHRIAGGAPARATFQLTNQPPPDKLLGLPGSAPGCDDARSSFRTWAWRGCAFSACLGACRRKLTSKRGAAVCRRAMTTGLGWADEVARIFDSRPEGPDFEPQMGYRGRPRLRVLLDGEDLVHSYAKAAHLHTGKWTGPLTAGIEKAVEYGGWNGFVPEDPTPDRSSTDPCMQSPEIMIFVAMPADMIEAINPAHIVDGYPENMRQELGRVVYAEEEGRLGYFINAWLKDLQASNRLITWARSGRLHGGTAVPKYRPNTLLQQKYYKEGQTVAFTHLTEPPIMLAQVMGAGSSLEIGEEVEALKEGRFISKGLNLDIDQYVPAKWEKARVVTRNYDGTYDLKFPQTHGPYHDPVRAKETRNLLGLPMLSLRKNLRYWGFGADSMPAKFRYQQEMDFALAVPPSKIRLPGALESIGDTIDTEGNQDWYLCSSRKFKMKKGGFGRRQRALEFLQKFQFSFEWIPTENGLEFRPVPNALMARSMRSTHSQVADQHKETANIAEAQRRKLARYSAQMDQLVAEVTQLPEYEAPKPRPAGPRGRFAMQEADSAGPRLRMR